MNLEEKLEVLEAQLSAAREEDGLGRVTEDGATPEAIRLGEMAALYRRDTRIIDILERRRKVVSEAIRGLVNMGEKIELAGLAVQHIKTSYFDKKAWINRCKGPFADAEEKAAIAALERYSAAEKAARANESIDKSGGIRVMEVGL